MMKTDEFFRSSSESWNSRVSVPTRKVNTPFFRDITAKLKQHKITFNVRSGRRVIIGPGDQVGTDQRIGFGNAEIIAVFPHKIETYQPLIKGGRRKTVRLITV